MPVVSVTERVSAPFAGSRVDRAEGVIYGALICGPESANGGNYSRRSFGDGGVYRGRHVYLNHRRGQELRAEDKIGWFGDDIRFRDNGMPEGDFHVLKSHPMAEVVLEAAERNPSLFGFSHVARIDTKDRGGAGRYAVESVLEVRSIDLVADPATTKGLFEHKGSAVATTLRAVIESRRGSLPPAGQKATRKLLLVAEDDAAMGGMLDTPVPEPEPDADDGDAVKGAFKAAIEHIVEQAMSGEIDPGEAIKKIKLMLRSHGEATGEATPADTSDDLPDAAEESRKRVDLFTVYEECQQVGYANPSRLFLEALAAQPDVEKRKKLIAECRPAATDKPQSAARHLTANFGAEKAAAKAVAESKSGANGDAKTVHWD